MTATHETYTETKTEAGFRRAHWRHEATRLLNAKGVPKRDTMRRFQRQHKRVVAGFITPQSALKDYPWLQGVAEDTRRAVEVAALGRLDPGMHRSTFETISAMSWPERTAHASATLKDLLLRHRRSLNFTEDSFPDWRVATLHSLRHRINKARKKGGAMFHLTSAEWRRTLLDMEVGRLILRRNDSASAMAKVLQVPVLGELPPAPVPVEYLNLWEEDASGNRVVSFKNLRLVTTYDPETGVFRWTDRVNRRYSGGLPLPVKPYLVIAGHRYSRLRLIWMRQTGVMPSAVYTFNNEPSDKAWENLTLNPAEQHEQWVHHTAKAECMREGHLCMDRGDIGAADVWHKESIKLDLEMQLKKVLVRRDHPVLPSDTTVATGTQGYEIQR